VKFSSTLDSLPLSLIVDNQVKERLTGAIILVGVLVLLVPELLTGPKRVPATSEASADEPPLRSYTIELNEDGSRKAVPPAPTVDPSESPQPMGANSEMIDDSSAAVDELEANTSADDETAPKSDVRVAAAPMQAATQADAAKTAAQDGSKAPAEKPVPARVQPKGDVQAERAGTASGDQRTAAARTEPPVSKSTATKPAAASDAKSGTARANERTAGTAKASTPAPVATADSAPTPQTEAASKASASKAAPKEAAPKASVAKADSAKSTTSKRKGSGWAIQVGSFASRANADRLANELKGKGFSAFVSEGTSGGKKLFRVRVGPETDKAAAQSLAGRLRAAGRPGSLVPQS
jgi:DedD protein